MRMRGVCVNVEVACEQPLRLKARVYQHDGKSRIVYGRTLCLLAHDTQSVKAIIEKTFRGRVRDVWITYEPELKTPAHFMVFEPIQVPETLAVPVSSDTGPDQ